MARGRRGNGEGTIYRDEARNRWIGQITIDGKRRSIYADTREKARLQLTAMARDRDRGIAIADGQQTVGQWLDEWLESKRGHIKESAWMAYETRIRCHLKPGLGRHKLAKLTPRHVQTFYADKLASDLSTTTVKHMHEALHKALQDALHLGLVVRNAADVPNKPKLAKSAKPIYDARQVRRVLRTVQDDRLAALAVLVLNTGMRQGELIALKWSDVDLSCDVLRVQENRSKTLDGFIDETPKTESGRRAIPLTPQAVEALRAHRTRQLAERIARGPRWQERDLVFPSTRGTHLLDSNVRRWWYQLVEKAGVPRIPFHNLRHTAATWLIASGVPANVVQEMLGHADPATTMRIYGHVMPRGAEQAAQVMSRLMREALDEDEEPSAEKDAQ